MKEVLSNANENKNREFLGNENQGCKDISAFTFCLYLPPQSHWRGVRVA